MNDNELVCRFHGTREQSLERDRLDGCTFARLSCGCWQREPDPGEVVFSIRGGYEEVGASFEIYAPD